MDATQVSWRLMNGLAKCGLSIRWNIISLKKEGGLFGGANGGLSEGSRQGVLPRTSAASVLVPAVSHSHPSPLQKTLQHWQGEQWCVLK